MSSTNLRSRRASITSAPNRGKDTGSRVLRHSVHHSIVFDILHNLQLLKDSQSFHKKNSAIQNKSYTLTDSTKLTGFGYADKLELQSKTFNLSETYPLFGNTEDFSELNASGARLIKTGSEDLSCQKRTYKSTKSLRSRKTPFSKSESVSNALPGYLPTLVCAYGFTEFLEDGAEGWNNLQSVDAVAMSIERSVKRLTPRYTVTETVSSESKVKRRFVPPTSATTLKAAEEALNFFVKHSGNATEKYVQCIKENRQASALEPTKLICNQKSERYIISQAGVTHLTNDGNSKFNTLSIWLRDLIAVNFLRSSATHRRNTVRHCFGIWRRNVRRQVFRKCRNLLAPKLSLKARNEGNWQTLATKMEAILKNKDLVANLIIEEICSIVNSSGGTTPTLVTSTVKLFEELGNEVFAASNELRLISLSRAIATRPIVSGQNSNMRKASSQAYTVKMNEAHSKRVMRLAFLMSEAKLEEVFQCAKSNVFNWLLLTQGTTAYNSVYINLSETGEQGELTMTTDIIVCLPKIEEKIKEIVAALYNALLSSLLSFEQKASKSLKAEAAISERSNCLRRTIDSMACIGETLSAAIYATVSEHQNAWNTSDSLLNQAKAIASTEPCNEGAAAMELLLKQLDELEVTYQRLNEAQQFGSIRVQASQMMPTLRDRLSTCKSIASSIVSPPLSQQITDNNEEAIE